jgi:hypothetical protein
MLLSSSTLNMKALLLQNSAELLANITELHPRIFTVAAMKISNLTLSVVSMNINWLILSIHHRNPYSTLINCLFILLFLPAHPCLIPSVHLHLPINLLAYLGMRHSDVLHPVMEMPQQNFQKLSHACITTIP